MNRFLMKKTCTVKSSKTTVSGIFRATKNLIFALNPLCTLNVKITLLYESGRYRWGGRGSKNNVHWTLSIALVEFRLSPNMNKQISKILSRFIGREFVKPSNTRHYAVA